jgi:hypothetical protein
LLNELELANVFESGETADLSLGQPDLPGPSAAGGTALAFVKDWHAAKLGRFHPQSQVSRGTRRVSRQYLETRQRTRTIFGLNKLIKASVI